MLWTGVLCVVIVACYKLLVTSGKSTVQPFSQKDKRVVTVFATPIFNKHTCKSAFTSAPFGTINHDLLWSWLEKHFGMRVLFGNGSIHISMTMLNLSPSSNLAQLHVICSLGTTGICPRYKYSWMGQNKLTLNQDKRNVLLIHLLFPNAPALDCLQFAKERISVSKKPPVLVLS